MTASAPPGPTGPDPMSAASCGAVAPALVKNGLNPDGRATEVTGVSNCPWPVPAASQYEKPVASAASSATSTYELPVSGPAVIAMGVEAPDDEPDCVSKYGASGCRSP